MNTHQASALFVLFAMVAGPLAFVLDRMGYPTLAAILGFAILTPPFLGAIGLLIWGAVTALTTGRWP